MKTLVLVLVLSTKKTHIIQEDACNNDLIVLHCFGSGVNEACTHHLTTLAGASDSRCSRCRASAKVWGSCDGLASSKPEGNHLKKCIANLIPAMTMMLVSLTLTWMAPENGWLSPDYSPFGAKGLFSMGETVRFREGRFLWFPLFVSSWTLDVSCCCFMPTIRLEMVPSRPDFGEGASTTWRIQLSKTKNAPKRC